MVHDSTTRLGESLDMILPGAVDVMYRDYPSPGPNLKVRLPRHGRTKSLTCYIYLIKSPLERFIAGKSTGLCSANLQLCRHDPGLKSFPKTCRLVLYLFRSQRSLVRPYDMTYELVDNAVRTIG